MASNIETEVLGEGDFDEWTAFVESCPNGSIYATPAYLDALCSATDGRFRILVVRRGEEIAGGLPLFEERHPGGRRLGPRLLLYYLSPVLRRYETRYPSERTSRYLKVMFALVSWLNRAGYDRTTLTCTPDIEDVRAFLVSGWSSFPSYTYVVPLDGDDTVWGRIDQNQRRLVGRSEDAGVTFTEDDDFDAFHALHAHTMDRKDRSTYLDPEAFRSYFRTLHGQGLATLYQARLPDGRAVATQMVLLGRHPVAQTVSAAGHEDHLSLGVNAFLRWRGFQALGGAGFAATDLTDAALNPVTRFKSQLGGELALKLVLEGPPSARWRLAEGADRLRRRARGAAGKLARLVTRRS